MPRLALRQEGPHQIQATGHAPHCQGCGNRRTFWVWRDGELRIGAAWEIQPTDKLVACGRCRSRTALLAGAANSEHAC